MQKPYCPECARLYVPCPARADGEPTFVGFYPCLCSRQAFVSNRRDGESFADYKLRIDLESPPPITLEELKVKRSLLVLGNWRDSADNLERALIVQWLHMTGGPWPCAIGLEGSPPRGVALVFEGGQVHYVPRPHEWPQTWQGEKNNADGSVSIRGELYGRIRDYVMALREKADRFKAQSLEA